MRLIQAMLFGCCLAVAACAGNPGLTKAEVIAGVQIAWPFAQTELTKLAASKGGTVGADINKALPAISADVANLNTMQDPASLSKFIADVTQLNNQLPPGTIGTQDESHVQEIIAAANALNLILNQTPTAYMPRHQLAAAAAPSASS